MSCHSHLMVLNYSDRNRDDVSRAHLAWGKLHRERVGPVERPSPTDANPERRLKIGYLSYVFQDHVDMMTVLGVLETHDRSVVQVFCYQQNTASDHVTARCKAAADTWVDVSSLSAQETAQRIRQDEIDVLIDVGGHMGAASALYVMLYRPAPIQVRKCAAGEAETERVCG